MLNGNGAYKIDKCPGCGVRVMVQDADGRFIPKQNCKMTDLVYDIKNETENGMRILEDAHSIRITMCLNCFENPDLEKLHAAIMHDEMEGVPDSAKAFFKNSLYKLKRVQAVPTR